MNIARRDFKQLDVWRKAHLLTLEVYRVSQCFPRDELVGLTSQLRRSANSISANIAEGAGRGGRDYPRSCVIAFGSATETEHHLILAKDLGYLDDETFRTLNDRVIEVQRMLNALIRAIST